MMPRYKLLAPHVIDGARLEAGTEVDITCEPSPQMEPLDADGKRSLEAFLESRLKLESDYPNAGWSVNDRLWHGYLVRDRLRALAQERVAQDRRK